VNVFSFWKHIVRRDLNHGNVYFRDVEFRFWVLSRWIRVVLDMIQLHWLMNDLLWLIKFLIFSRKINRFIVFSRQYLDDDSFVLNIGGMPKHGKSKRWSHDATLRYKSYLDGQQHIFYSKHLPELESCIQLDRTSDRSSQLGRIEHTNPRNGMIYDLSLNKSHLSLLEHLTTVREIRRYEYIRVIDSSSR
jgi:hypothetical protein